MRHRAPGDQIHRPRQFQPELSGPADDVEGVVSGIGEGGYGRRLVERRLDSDASRQRYRLRGRVELDLRDEGHDEAAVLDGVRGDRRYVVGPLDDTVEGIRT